jgi:hypothetical protein
MNLPDDCGCKVDYVSQKHDLKQLDDRIRRRRENEDYSLRDLETYVNSRVLRAAMERAGMSVLEGRAEDYYERLANEEEDSLKHKEARRHLRDAGVAVDEVMDDFVCYQTVRKHLNECLGISTSEEYEPDLRKSRNQIGAMKARAESVVHTEVDRLWRHGVLAIGEPDVIVSVKVRCSECGRVYSPATLFDNQGCTCSSISEQTGRSKA